MSLLDLVRPNTDKETQAKQILKILRTNGKITNYEMWNMHIQRGSERIRELKADGYRIVSHHVKGPLWEYVFKGHEDDDEPRFKEFDHGD